MKKKYQVLDAQGNIIIATNETSEVFDIFVKNVSEKRLITIECDDGLVLIDLYQKLSECISAVPDDCLDTYDAIMTDLCSKRRKVELTAKDIAERNAIAKEIVDEIIREENKMKWPLKNVNSEEMLVQEFLQESKKNLALTQMKEFCKENGITSIVYLSGYAKENNKEWFKVLCTYGGLNAMKSYLKQLEKERKQKNSMTNQEALEWLECIVYEQAPKDQRAMLKAMKALEMVIELEKRNMDIETLKNYMQFEDECIKKNFTFKSLIEAREKQIPKAPIRRKGECFAMSDDGKESFEIIDECPACGNQKLVVGYPCVCGQKLNW